ncbi:MAG: hypothetical protein ACREF4_08175 [Gammaproteobacteria bacterium]
MRRTTILAFTVAVCLGAAGAASGQQQEACVFSSFSKLPSNTGLALGPILKSIIDAYPQLGTAIVAARDAWDGTNAVDRLGNWNGIVSASDCPVGLPIQLGRWTFPWEGVGR